MRSLTATSLALAALTVGACNSPQWPEPSRTTMNSWSVDEYHRDSIEAAIVSQHTIYPYHFVQNGAALNELGVRDVMVLARHYRDNPGELNLRRAGAEGELYDDRLDTLSTMLADNGVDTSRVRIENRHPGGDGATSERVLFILEEKMDEPLTPDNTGISSFRGN